MAIYHMEVKTGSAAKGGAANHGRYIRRDERYSGSFEDKRHPHESISVNLPKWAADADEVWIKTDALERKNASLYKEFEISLPIEFTEVENKKLAVAWVRTEFKNQFSEVAFHWKPGNPHCHIQVSERIDLVGRLTAEHYFKRPAAAYRDQRSKKMMQPNEDQLLRGGCKKSERFTRNDLAQLDGEQIYQFRKRVKAARKEALIEVRKSWADAVNAELTPRGIDLISHLSYEARGIDKPAGVHLSPSVRALAARGVMSPSVLIALETEKRRSDVISRRLEKEKSESSTRDAETVVDRTVSRDKINAGEQPSESSGDDGKTAGSHAPKTFSQPAGTPSGDSKGFERIDQLHLGRDGVYYFDSHACSISPLVRVHRDGYDRAAWFINGRQGYVAIEQTGGGIGIPELRSLTDEQLGTLLRSVDKTGDGLILKGTEAELTRAAKICDDLGIKHNVPPVNKSNFQGVTSAPRLEKENFAPVF